MPSRSLAILAFAGLIDIALTLLGQNSEYWAGDYSKVNEGNPLAKPLLARDPWLFAAVAGVWVFGLVAVLAIWKGRLANGVALVSFAGHIFGGAAWMMSMAPPGLVFAVLYMAAMIGLWSRGRSSIPSEELGQRGGETR